MNERTKIMLCTDSHKYTFLILLWFIEYVEKLNEKGLNSLENRYLDSARRPVFYTIQP